LARLAAKREDLAGATRRATVRLREQQPVRVSQSRAAGRPGPVRCLIVMVVAVLATGLAADLARPLLASAFLDPGVRLRETSRWPACRRLDRHADGCVYTSGGGASSLLRVAFLTGIPVEHVIAANRHLPVSPETLLPQGSRIVIWRGRLNLLGASQ